MNEFTNKINNVWQKGITLIKKSLDIDSTMLEVVNVRGAIDKFAELLYY